MSSYDTECAEQVSVSKCQRRKRSFVDKWVKYLLRKMSLAVKLVAVKLR